jgi:hypothetical protein
MFAIKLNGSGSHWHICYSFPEAVRYFVTHDCQCIKDLITGLVFVPAYA